jgi:S-DNA-T family DNA segregation ATPase FtsK/SpoIIIE
MLFQSPDAAAPLRMQGVFVSDTEIQRLVRYWKGARGIETAAALPAPLAAPSESSHFRQPPLFEGMGLDEDEARADGEDELLEDAIQAVREMKKASISLLQRRLRIGYTRAARLIDALEEKGIIGPAKPGAQQREVLNLGETMDPTRDGATEKRTWTTE